MSKTAAIPMDKETQRFQFIFTGQQYLQITELPIQTECIDFVIYR